MKLGEILAQTGASILKLIGFAIVVGWYLGVLIFDENSLSVYLDLRAKCEALSEEIYKLNDNNSRLQKEYFELKSIQGN